MTVIEMATLAKKHDFVPLFNAGVYDINYDRFNQIHIQGTIKPDGGEWSLPEPDYKFTQCHVDNVTIVIEFPTGRRLYPIVSTETGEAAAEGIAEMQRGVNNDVAAEEAAEQAANRG